MPKPLAVVVDDDQAVRDSLCSFLEHEDVEAATAADGVSGLDLLQAVAPDMAFLDLRLPLLDGLSLLKLTKELKPKLEVIMMSASGLPRDIVQAMEYGAYTFVTKPCDFELLARIIKEILLKDLPRECRRLNVPVAVRSGGPGGSALREQTTLAKAKGGEEMAIVRWSPFRDLLSVQQEVNRLFDDLMTRRAEGAGEGPVWLPAVDISETEDAVMVKLEVPGVDKDDIKISVSNNVLTVKGEKKMEREVKDENYHRVERVYGNFLRSLELPTAVEADKVKASYKDGVLVITLPKSEEVKPREIAIES